VTCKQRFIRTNSLKKSYLLTGLCQSDTARSLLRLQWSLWRR